MIFLKPGDLFFCRNKPSAPVKVITVLGSCISVILTHPRTGAAGMCHAYLPVCADGPDCPGNCPEPWKYVRCVIRFMLDTFHNRGIHIRQMEAGIYGGSDMLFGDTCSKAVSTRCRSVGTQNIEAAVSTLELLRIHVSRTDMGGDRGRKLIFDPQTGLVSLIRLQAGFAGMM